MGESGELRTLARLEKRLSEIEKEIADNPTDYVLLAELDTEQDTVKKTLETYYDEYVALEDELNAEA